MTNETWIKSLPAEELGHELCRLCDCGRCPVQKKCRRGKNGFITWLKEKHKDE